MTSGRINPTITIIIVVLATAIVVVVINAVWPSALLSQLSLNAVVDHCKRYKTKTRTFVSSQFVVVVEGVGVGG